MNETRLQTGEPPTCDDDDDDDEVARRIGEFINVTSRPLFNYRMADGLYGATHVPNDKLRSASTRRRNAARELDALIRDYVARHPAATN